jgi:hypothetical protein
MEVELRKSRKLPEEGPLPYDRKTLFVEPKIISRSDEESLVKARPSQFIEYAIKIPTGGKLSDYSFTQRRYLKTIYDSNADRKLLMAGRQVEKSTFLGNNILSHMAIVPFFRCLYVSPSNTQTKTFSKDRIKEPIDVSPILARYSNSKLLANVLEKKFVNQSQVTLRFAFLNADRCRGIPSDFITIDEFQDILLDNVPVIEECASHSDWKLFTYGGTPKSLDNAIEHYWSRFSTQCEWVIPCRRHGLPKEKGSWHWNILDEDNIGKSGLVCDRCGELIRADDPDATWVAMNPKPKVEKPYEGYRIPQLMVPWIDWLDILDKQKKYSRPKFHNEVLGRSYDSGTRPLTRQDMQDNSWDKLSMAYYQDVKQYSTANPIFMGIDWGCHDDKTRILTERGFIHFRNLLDDDKVAQFDEHTREMTYVKPELRTVRQWNGDLIHFKNKTLDMMLTNTHRMLLRGCNSTKWLVEKAGKVSERSSHVKFVGSIDWKGPEKRTWILPGVPSSAGYPGSSTRIFMMDDWLEFLGYYLSEGGLCYAHSKDATKRRPSCLKMSQRSSVNANKVKKIKSCMDRLGLAYQEYPNSKTKDVNWTICGKQFWKWVETNVGTSCSSKSIPKEFLGLSKRQLQILFDSMMLGDGNADTREGNNNGSYLSTSKSLCEDFQILCIKLGLRATLSTRRKASGNRKTLYSVCWSSGDDHQFNSVSKNVKKVAYDGKVYCCKVSTGFIVTERNGRIAYQGNTGENSYTVMTLGGYLPFAPNWFTWFYMYRFEGMESEPRVQMEIIKRNIIDFNVRVVGSDYGGGHHPNDELVREFGADKIKKYQWVGNIKKKIQYEPRMGVPRFLCHRTEVMSDMFNAIKRRDVFRYPRWEEFEEPYAMDFLNIFSEYNDRLRMNVYKHAPGCPDDTFHACTFGFLASFHVKPRPDVILPSKEVNREHYDPHEENDIGDGSEVEPQDGNMSG